MKAEGEVVVPKSSPLSAERMRDLASPTPGRRAHGADVSKRSKNVDIADCRICIVPYEEAARPVRLA